MEKTECAWRDLFDDSDREGLEEGFFVAGFISITFGVWLNLSILLTKLRLDRSYRNLANFTIAACIRRIVPLVAHISSFELVEHTKVFALVRCEFFAFLETFLAVFEVEWLTHVCIERYVVAKYMLNGWLVQNYHYTLFQCLCLIFACLYSLLPLLGIGRYGLDFACTFCTFDMILPESWQRYLVVLIFLFRSVKPATVMFLMLTWAWILEKKIACSEEKQKQAKFTKVIIMITLVNQLCWFPIALIRGGVVFSQLYTHPTVPASVFYIKWAMWIHWVSPGLTAMAMFVADHRIRNKMLRLNSIEKADQLDIKKAI